MNVYHLDGVITFDSIAQRNRANKAVAKLVADWNAVHTVDRQFTVVRMSDVTLEGESEEGVPTGVMHPAVDFAYTIPETGQADVELAHDAIYFNLNSNAYRDILGLSIWLG